MRIFREWVLAIALYVALVLDGSLAFYLHQFQNWHGYGASCWLMPIGIMLIALFDDMNDKEIWLALGAGVVADIYNFGIVGVYTVFFPLACWCCKKIARFLPETFWARLIIVLLGLTLLDAFVWLILNMVGLISTSLRTLLISLALNLVWSLIFFCLSYAVWANLSTRYPFLVNLEAYRQ